MNNNTYKAPAHLSEQGLLDFSSGRVFTAFLFVIFLCPIQTDFSKLLFASEGSGGD